MSTAAHEIHRDAPLRGRRADDQLDDLRQRIRATRWPSTELAADRSQGVQLEALQALARYWLDGCDFGRTEACLNALPRFVSEIDGVDVHFVRGKIVCKQKRATQLITPGAAGRRPRAGDRSAARAARARTRCRALRARRHGRARRCRRACPRLGAADARADPAARRRAASVASLARRQERELRGWRYAERPLGDDGSSLVAALSAAAADVATHGVASTRERGDARGDAIVVAGTRGDDERGQAPASRRSTSMQRSQRIEIACLVRDAGAASIPTMP